VIHFSDGDDLHARPAEERFVGDEDLSAVNVAHLDRHPHLLAEQVHDRAAGDAFQDVGRYRRGDGYAIAHHEKVLSAALGNVAVVVEHERLVKPKP